MIFFTFILSGILEILLPIVIMLWLKRRFKVSWKLFGVGMLTFIGSQVVHIPLLIGVRRLAEPFLPPYVITVTANLLNAIILGLLAGICEETARLVGYYYLKDRAKAYPAALALGDGHGGMEAILIGLSLLIQSILILWVSKSGVSMLGITPQNALAYTDAAWYVPLISLFERLTAMSIQIALSVMVWRAFTRRAWGWFAGAILYHAFIDALAVALVSFGYSIFLVEGILGVFMLINLGLLYLAYLHWGKASETVPDVVPDEDVENQDTDDSK
jgi:uncharacterized membrane protein YhfC